MKTVLITFIILFLTSIIGCVSIEKRRLIFIDERNFDIGRVVFDVPLPEPIDIIKIDEAKSKYLYKFEDSGCQWIYIVDNKSKRIISWEFISDPDFCYIEFKGPW